jgi:hypothetical protein
MDCSFLNSAEDPKVITQSNNKCKNKEIHFFSSIQISEQQQFEEEE